jgi:hypothetical protein
VGGRREGRGGNGKRMGREGELCYESLYDTLEFEPLISCLTLLDPDHTECFSLPFAECNVGPGFILRRVCSAVKAPTHNDISDTAKDIFLKSVK